MTSSTLAPPFVAPLVITTSVENTPVVNTLITPTAVSSPVIVPIFVHSSSTIPLATPSITTSSERWSKSAKLQPQTTLSGKENENVEDC